MKFAFCKWTLFLGLVGALAGTKLAAQENGTDNRDSVVLVHTYQIRRIYLHLLGYRIDIMDYHGDIRTIYAKSSWFVNAEQRNPKLNTFEVAATMKYRSASSVVPSETRYSNFLTLQYENGRLLSMVIYVDEPKPSPSSIRIETYENIDDKFDIKTVVFSAPPPTANPAPEDAEQQ